MEKKLYVGNLSFDTTEDTLRTLFAEHGEVESVSLVTDRDSGRSRGFAFIEMATEADARAAIDGMNGQMVDGREIRVDEARPRPDRRGDRGRGGRGGGGRDSSGRGRGNWGSGDRGRGDREGRSRW